MKGITSVPADKSIVHRSILFAAISSVTTTIKANAIGRDNLASLRVVMQLGAEVAVSCPSHWYDMICEEVTCPVTLDNEAKSIVIRITGKKIADLSAKGKVLS